MLIHYLESLILVCASVILHVYNLRRPSRAAAWLSAGAYFAAMLAKEIAAPLILLLALLPGKDFHRSLKAVAPHGCALLVYLIWRYIMLGTLFGGYGWAIERREYLSVLTSLPRKLLLACTGPETWTGALFAALILFGLVAVLRDQPIRILAIVGVVALLAPVIPVSKEFQPRYALPLWVGMTALFATSCNRLQTRRLSAALSVTALLLALVCNRQAWALEYASDARMTAEANAFLKLSGNALLRTPAIPPAALNELNWLKQEQEQRPSTNGWFYDDLFLCEGGGDGKRVWQYDSNARQVIEVTQRLPDLKAAYCGTIRPDSRLSTEFHFRGGTLSWNFGPYGDGSWRVLFGEGAQAFDVPREGAFRLGDISGMAVRIRYSSPAGWVTYSPVLMLDFAHHRDFEWHR